MAYYGVPAVKITRTCLECGKTFYAPAYEVRKGKANYCSRTCLNTSQKKSKSANCEYCGKGFRTKKTNHGMVRFCSKSCFYKSVVENNKTRKTTKTCPVCGKVFRLHGELDPKVCCSQKCGAIRRFGTEKITRFCATCNKELLMTPSRVRNKIDVYCSRKCYEIALSGKKNYFWKGGKFYTYGVTWPIQRKLAYERDGGICQKCGLTETQSLKKYKRKNAVHHVISRKTFRKAGKSIEEANALTNLITLCMHCHSKAEHRLIVLQPKLL